MGFEAARTRANGLLDRAAGKKVYRMPRVLSVEEEQTQKERLRQRFPLSRNWWLLDYCHGGRVSSVWLARDLPGNAWD